ncbi:MAG: DNA polymerase III subunit delta [Lachnospiraceae bacterium]|nr:DNA polymerase III subunit delta [Lachnospiraceae bacterium]
MKSILTDIQNKDYKQVYLLYGEEVYLKHQYRDKLKDALMDGADTMNYHFFEGKDVQIPSIIDLAETMPFFADRRVIVIENSGLFKQGGEQLAEYITNPSPTVFFVFTESDVDKRSRLFKAARDAGRVVEFVSQDTAVLTKWIRSLAAKESKTISGDAIAELLERTGQDMRNIKSEFEKLVCYCMYQPEITKDDVKSVCITRISNRIFEMVEAISDKQNEKAILLYHDLIELREPPMRILYLLTRQFNILLQVKELSGKGYSDDQTAKKIGIPPFFLSKYKRQASRFSIRTLIRALEECAVLDESIKRGLIADRMGLELLIVNYIKE